MSDFSEAKSAAAYVTAVYGDMPPVRCVQPEMDHWADETWRIATRTLENVIVETLNSQSGGFEQ